MLVRLGIAAGAAILMLVFCQTWKPPFAYRAGHIPARDIVARVTFQVPDEAKTQVARAKRRGDVITFYRNDVGPLDDLRAELKDALFLVLSAASFEEMTDAERGTFEELADSVRVADKLGPDAEPPTRKEQFQALKTTFASDPKLEELDKAVSVELRPFYETGLLKSLKLGFEEGNQRIIRVYPAGRPDEVTQQEVSKVRIPQVRLDLGDAFRQRFGLEDNETAQTAAAMIEGWLESKLPVTLTYDEERSEKAKADAAAEVEQVMTTYRSGMTPIAAAGKPLGIEQLELLQHEWMAVTGNMRWPDRLLRIGAYIGMIMALYLLCGSYIYFVDDRDLIHDPRKLTRLLGLMTLTVGFCYFASHEQWQAIMIPLVLASITAVVVYGRELAILLLTAACVGITLLTGNGLAELVSMTAAALSGILLLGHLRSRTRLLYVGLLVAGITALTVIGVGIVTGQPVSSSPLGSGTDAWVRGTFINDLVVNLATEASWVAFCIVIAFLAMTGLLPLVERIFGVQTDLSLLELGDASHPLLRQLAQRAPGTYNHSINVASIAEAAADVIGANGLLVRVGAYFHDIGKMFKPDYFIENQGQGPNQHDTLQPAMSTLVIIAHVKDGADLARSYHLPEPIVDFILQHHGTTLVEYFYREAAKRSEEDPGKSVSDNDFRYPGPRPQTLEAAVMMLADSVESASRTLVDPTPARIKSLVDMLAMKKLTDGQFDECGLTLMQLDRIKQSLVKSLTAIYHARVKYPGQQSA
ncbi:MAG: HDIG domain-containing metalloprotein [Pirellulaceae bacterium]